MTRPAVEPAFRDRGAPAAGPTARRVAGAMAVAALVMGTLVIVGWHARSSRLVTVLPALGPMQYNTALLLALAGAALLTAPLRRKVFTVTLAAAVGFVGLLTALEYLTGVNIGADQLLMQDYVRPGDADPGRMGPKTALAFALLAAGLLTGALIRDRKLAARLLALAGSIVAALGLVSLAGYVAGVSGTYAWGGLSHMAVHTAAGVAAVGIAMVCVAWDDGYVAEGGPPGWLPMPVATAALTAALVLSQAVASQQSDLLDRQTELVLEEVTGAIDAKARVYLEALTRMARRWDVEGRSDVAGWLQDAEAYARDFEGEDAIAWVDADMVVRRIAPFQRHRRLLGDRMARHSAPGVSLLSAFEHGSATMSEAFEFEDGRAVVLLCAPIHTQGGSDGAIVAILDPAAFYASTLSGHVAQDYAVAVRIGAQLVYASGAGSDGAAWVKRGDLTIGGVDTGVTVSPSAAVIASARTALPVIVFLVGVVIAASATLVVRLSQLTARGARDLTRANEDLTTEVAARQESEGRLSAVLQTAADGIITLTDEGHIETLNPAAEAMFGWPAGDVRGIHIGTLVPAAATQEHDSWMARCVAAMATTGDRVRTEALGRRQDGSTFDMSVAMSEVAMPDGRRFTALVRDISPRKVAEQEREELLRRVLRAQEVERAKVAEELHEQIGQELTAVVYRLRAANATESHDEGRKHVSEAAADLAVALEGVRELATDMRPGALDLGFEAALTREVLTVAARAGLQGRTEVVGVDVGAIDPDTAAALYRVVRAALDNVARHANAESVVVTIRGFEDSVAILVEDDGVGFDAEAVLSGPVAGRFGIFAMAERTRMMGGSFATESSPGAGTSVLIEQPLAPSTPHA
jgi:PAS domain S-box-containing protein